MEMQGPPPDVKSRLKASYNAMAPQYNAWTAERHNSLRLKWLAKLLELCPQIIDSAAPHVLELGCGAGIPVLTEILDKSATATVTALDLSDVQIDFAKANLKDYEGRVEYVVGDMVAATAELPEKSCTAVIALYSLIHLSQSDQKDMMKRIAEILEDGGCFLGCFAKDEMEGVVMESWLDDKGWMFWSGLGVDGTKGVVEGEGLKVEVGEVEEGDEETFWWVIARK